MVATVTAQVQDGVVVLPNVQLLRIVPSGFYYAGQSAPTQLRNSAVTRFGTKKYIVAGMVDTSGYSSDVRGQYEGFLITDMRINVGAGALPTGAYGFGFSDDGSFNVFDVGGTKIMTLSTTDDSQVVRPRPLMMVKAPGGVRLYSGRKYVLMTVAPAEPEL